MADPNNGAQVPTPIARIDKNLREAAGTPAVDLVVDRMRNDLLEDQIPFQVEALAVDEHGYLVADVRLGVLVRVVVDTGFNKEVEAKQPKKASPEPLELTDEFVMEARGNANEKAD